MITADAKYRMKFYIATRAQAYNSRAIAQYLSRFAHIVNRGNLQIPTIAQTTAC